LTLYVHRNHTDEVALDATLSRETKDYLSALQTLQIEDVAKNLRKTEERGSSSTDSSADSERYDKLTA